MGIIYGKKIRDSKGAYSIDNVPKLWRRATEKWLKENTSNEVEDE